MAKPGAEERGMRFRAVREAHTRRGNEPLPQTEFAGLLRAAAARRYGSAVERVYSQSVVNRLELGDQKPTPQDIDLYASVDPLQRGKLWLAWGEKEDATMGAPRHGPSVIQENEEAVFEEPTLPEKRSAKKRRKGA